MPRKSVTDGSSKQTQGEDQNSHKPAKHIEEIARLASSDETNKNPGKMRKTKD